MYCCHCIGIGTEIVSTVAYATKQLQQRYISSRCSSTVDEWPPYQRKHYTTLAFIHDKSKVTNAVRFSVMQEFSVAGNINTSQLYRHSNSNTNMTKNISDIFLPIIASDGSFVDLHILIEGAPGIGKTVLAKEIAYKWGKNELLTSKRLILLVFLRECHQIQLKSVEDLVQHVFVRSKVTTCLADYLLQTEGEDTVIIFDGFDELPEESGKKSIIVDIINRRILTKSCLVITSRPTASSSLHGSVDRRVEIVGFTEEDRLDYIQTALENHDEQVKAVQHYLQSNPTINALCYIPLNMTILLCLVEDGIDRLPKTQTEMYKRFIETTIIRFIKKYENHDTIINIAELPHPYDKLLTELAKFAYKALKTDKIVFTLPEIKKGCPNLTMTSSNWNGLGLLKAVQCYSKEIGNDQVTLHFLHFSIQEYMAAWYISTLSDRKQIKLLQNTFWEHRYYNTWIMYVGITGRCTFALRHFLSGNRFQLYSKFFGASKVSIKFLKHKIKCLHLFQCLVEADKVDSVKQLESVKELFQNNQIDLSNQTLLPSDLNTLGFFLIRSINKEWDELNLSNCRIGSNGSNVLCDRLLDKDVRCIVTIKMVNFSYNQLDFSSFMRLFGLFNSWHTSEVIITDDASLEKTTDQKIEDIVLQSSTLVLVHITSWLFCKNAELSKIRHILSNTTNIESVYLLNCTWRYDSEVLALLRKQKLNKVRIIGSFNLIFLLFLENNLIKTLASILLNSNDSVNMFVYSPTMPDEIADDISNLILSSNKDISGVMLIVSSSKVQGMVNTCSLSNELSALEIFNLSTYIRYLNTKMCPWSLESNSDNKDVIFTFIELLHKTDSDWKLKVLLWENNTLIAHNAKFKSFDKFKHFTNNNIYLSSCDVSEPQYDAISGTCSSLHILNSPECVEMLHAKLSHNQFVSKEMFIYCNIEYDLMNSLIEFLSHDHFNISAVLVVNGILVGIHPNSELIALAFQLQPLPIAAAISYNTELKEIDISENNFVTASIRKIMKALQGIDTLKKLCLSSNNITGEAADDIAAAISSNIKLQEIYISENYLLTAGVRKIMKALQGINTLRKLCLNNNNITGEVADDIAAVVSFNTSLQEIDISRNDLQTKGIMKIVKALQQTYGVTKLCLSNNNITSEAADDIAAAISCNTKLQEIDISENYLLTAGVRKIMKSLQGINTLRNLCLNKNNITGEAADDIAAVVSFNTSLQEIDISRNDLQTKGIMKIVKALQQTYGVTKLCLSNNNITGEAADDIATVISCNTSLQEIDVSGNNLQTIGATKIARALGKIYTLEKLNLSNNNVTGEAADDIAAAISCNTKLQEIDISENYLLTANVRKILKALQGSNSLRKLCLNNNNITGEAADDIAAVVSFNTSLQEIDISRNDLQTKGIMKIAKALQQTYSVTKLCLSNNNITSEAAGDIAAVVSCNRSLQEIDISRNDLQTKGIMKIVIALQQTYGLTKLYLSNNNITDIAADDIAIVISHNIHLQEFHISGNKLLTIGAIKIAQALQGICSLKALYISDNEIGFTAAHDIATTISHANQLHELDISKNNFTQRGIEIILKPLQNCDKLTKLYISDNSVTDAITHDIGTVISCNTVLREIDISGSYLQARGVINVAVALQSIVMLTKLCISNSNMTHHAANDIAIAITCNIHLQHLSIGGNDLLTEGATIIAKSLQKISTLKKLYIYNNKIRSAATDDIAAAVSCNPYLEEFDISENEIEGRGAIKLAKSFQKISLLKKLFVDHNRITDEAADDFASVISHNPHLIAFKINGNLLQNVKIIKDAFYANRNLTEIDI